MNKNKLIESLIKASKDGTLLTPRHAPNNLSTTYPNYRTVLTHDLADNLDTFIASSDYVAREYRNNSYLDSPIYIEIEPSHASGFSVTASGVAPNSPLTSHAVNRLVVVSGTNQGWHVFGEDSSIIKAKEHAGEIDYLGDLA
jgi:hypothetical protein